MSAVEPGALVRAALDRFPSLDPVRPYTVVAAGKAASPMFAAASTMLHVAEGVIATRFDQLGAVPAGVEVFDAGHPSPNEASVVAAARALAAARAMRPDGVLLVLLSGGASAMLAAPADGITLEDKIDVSRALMAAGAPIHELNCVRKHLSRVKGGRLAAAARRSITLALSDVHGPVPDDPSVIGSGPTVPDETTFADALAIVRARRIRCSPGVLAHLERGVRGDADESVKPGDPRLARATYAVIGNRETAVAGARRVSEELGYRTVVIGPATTGEAREAAASFVAEARSRAAGATRPICVIASGETTVTVRGDGMGGRNQEFALAAAAALAGSDEPMVLGSAGTDGIDGPTPAAGALVDSATLSRATRLGLDPAAYLARNDAYHFFEPLADLIQWGPTGTNVGDIHVLLIA